MTKEQMLQTIEKQDDQVVQLLDKYNLAWTTKKLKLSLSDGTPTPFYGILRGDTKNVFSTCREGYEIFQNWELLELVQKVADASGLKVDTGGHFKNGAKVYFQIKTGNINGIGPNNDQIITHATAINSHDGSALKWGGTNIVISCSNTFNYAYGQLKNSAHHTASMRDKIDESMKKIEEIRIEEQRKEQLYFKMASVEAKESDVKKVIQIVTGVDMNLDPVELEEIYSTRNLNKVSEISLTITDQMIEKGNTLWGLFNGWTKYSTHEFGPKKETADSVKRRDMNKMVGSLYQLDNKVFNELTHEIV